MTKKLCISCLLYLLMTGHYQSWSQNDNELAVAYEAFDELIGQTNSGIFDGVEYYERYPVRNEKHKFFKNADFKIGSVVYDRHPFLNLLLKYDVYGDELLVQNSEVLGSPVTQLYKEKIATFSIEKHDFVHLNASTEKNEPVTGFFELLQNDTNLKLLKKHRKKMIKKTDEGVYYEFKDDPWYLLQKKEAYYKLKNEKSILTIYPELKDELNEFLRSITKEEKENTEDLFLLILKKISELRP